MQGKNRTPLPPYHPPELQEGVRTPPVESNHNTRRPNEATRRARGNRHSPLHSLQTIRPTISAAPATVEFQAPLEIRHILEKDCYACHSEQRRLAWFDQIVPGYWLVHHDILTAREHLNFSTIGAKPAPAQRATLFEAVNMIQLGAMPLPQFTALHPGARVTPEDLAILKAYLAPWSAPPAAASTTPEPASTPVSLTAISPEFLGSVLALVTWVQREDPHWFGASIPDSPRPSNSFNSPPPARLPIDTSPARSLQKIISAIRPSVPPSSSA